MITLLKKNSYIILFFIISFLMGLFILFSSEQKENTNVSIKVEQGDSIWSIAENYADSLGLSTNEVVQLIEKENKIYYKSIKTGVRITIPGLQIEKYVKFKIAYQYMKVKLFMLIIFYLT